MPSAPRDDRSNRRLKSERAHALAPARCCALAIVTLCLAFFATVAPTSIASTGAQESRAQRQPAGTRIATAKTPTIVALALSRVVDGIPQLPEDAVDRLAAAGQQAVGLVLLDIRGWPLRHASLPPASQRGIERDAYERGLSLQLAAAIKDARARTPGIAFGILGLPFEQGPSAAESNASYEAALHAVDVMNPLGGVIAAGTNPTAIVRDRYRSSLSLAGGRPVVFRGGSGWQVTTSPSGPTAQRGPQQAVASDDGSAAAAPVTAAGTSAPSVSSVVADWGTNASGTDLNADGTVDGFDLAVALALNPDELLAPPGGGGDRGGGGGGGSGGGGEGGGGGTPPDGGGSGPGGSGEGEDPLANAPVLVVGPGFDGPTPPPMPVGTSDLRGYSAKAIARWNVVPYQQFDAAFAVGVVAFHMNGIAKVQFSANGGPWVDVYEPSLNPQSGTYEFWALLDPQVDVGADAIEIRAIAHPQTAGQPRLLAGSIDVEDPTASGEHSMILHRRAPDSTPPPAAVYVSGSGSDTEGTGTVENPLRTIKAAFAKLGNAGDVIDHSVIRLLAGDYEPDDAPHFPRPVTESGWVTIEAAPGVPREQVVLKPGRFRIKHVRLRGLTLDHSLSTGPGLQNFNALSPFIWIDQCDAVGAGRQTGSRPILFSGWRRYYVTDTVASHYKDAFQSADIVRGVTAVDLGSDAFTDSRLIVNCRVDGISAEGTTWHPDVFMLGGAMEQDGRDNIIIFGLMATESNAQGLFADSIGFVNNIAIVNVLIEKDSGAFAAPPFSQWQKVDTSHLLLWHVAIVDGTWFWRCEDLSLVSVVGCVFGRMLVGEDGAGGAGVALDEWFQSNHFVLGESQQGVVRGVDVSVGPPGFIDAASNDFTPSGDSQLVGRVSSEATVRVDLFNRLRAEMTAVGPIEAMD